MKDLPDTLALEALARLEPGLLYVFVAGAGVGECIAVALPDRGWLLVDGCKTSEQYPLESIYSKYRRAEDDAVRALVLTHPHQDHAYGIAELIERSRPALIGVTGVDARETIVHAFEALSKRRDRRVTSSDNKVGIVGQAVQAILGSGAPLVGLHAGVRLPLGSSPVAATIQAPEKTPLSGFLDRLTRKPDLVDAANEVSTVIELELGKARIVLGGDLPRFYPSTTQLVPTGWDEVLRRRGQLGAHQGLKLPHHGSREAFDDRLNPQAADARRVWWVTPYNSAGLPDIADLQGLPRLLKQEPSVHLTALPASRRRQRAVVDPGVVRLDQLEPRTAGTRSGVRFADEAVCLAPEAEPQPLEPVWAAAFDRQGEIRGRWRGAVAVELMLPLPPKKRPAARKGKRRRRR